MDDAGGKGRFQVWSTTTANKTGWVQRLAIDGETGATTIGGELTIGSNPLRFTGGWTGFPDNATNRAEISNDTGTYKTLMIVGNKSAGIGRRVSVWDRLEVNGALAVSGNAFKPGGGSWAVSSDRSLKENIRPMEGVLDKLLRLRGVNFEWKEPEQQGNLTGTQMGLVAQEVEEVFPEWVGSRP